jgi:hypothetical protein
MCILKLVKQIPFGDDRQKSKDKSKDGVMRVRAYVLPTLVTEGVTRVGHPDSGTSGEKQGQNNGKSRRRNEDYLDYALFVKILCNEIPAVAKIIGRNSRV